MAASHSVPYLPSPPAERFFRLSLFFLLFVSVATLATTGKLDAISSLGALVLMSIKGVRLWNGKPTELNPVPKQEPVGGTIYVDNQEKK